MHISIWLWFHGRCVLLAGEKCLIKAVDAMAKSKWDDALKHLKCAESKA